VIRSLAYLGVATPAHDEWTTFGPEVLGLQTAEPGPDGAVRLKMDEAVWRLSVHPGEKKDLAYIGWSVADRADADEVARALAGAGVEAREGDAETAKERAAEGFLWFTDPFGFRHELSWGRSVVPASFRPGRPLTGFKTGEQGMGHVVLLVPSLEKADAFFAGVLGFRLSDHIFDGQINARFYHINGRHHSLAVAEAPITALQHMMLEVTSMDDVGQCLDECQRRGVAITRQLGRHSNDRMTSFYMLSPADFHIEYGYGGIAVEDPWVPKTYDRISIWGHQHTEDPVPPGLVIRGPEGE